ncbi:MAG TPA: hypothetical protein VE641_07620 [Chthoniobacterales bacterium]|jgi:hypothetical protein|nr:hypothetical protein [Chthoniobacterales bacterium]
MPKVEQYSAGLVDVESCLHDASAILFPTGLWGFNPEGMIGLSLGFQPQEQAPNRYTPWKGLRQVRIELCLRNLDSIAIFGAGHSFYLPGLQPQAESYYPSGID